MTESLADRAVSPIVRLRECFYECSQQIQDWVLARNIQENKTVVSRVRKDGQIVYRMAKSSVDLFGTRPDGKLPVPDGSRHSALMCWSFCTFGDEIRKLAPEDTEKIYAALEAAGHVSFNENRTCILINQTNLRSHIKKFPCLERIWALVSNILAAANQRQFKPPLDLEKFRGEAGGAMIWSCARKLEENYKNTTGRLIEGDHEIEKFIKSANEVIESAETSLVSNGSEPLKAISALADIFESLDSNKLSLLLSAETPTTGLGNKAAEETELGWNNRCLDALPDVLRQACLNLTDKDPVLARNIFWHHFLQVKIASDAQKIKVADFGTWIPQTFEFAVWHGNSGWCGAAFVYAALCRAGISIASRAGNHYFLAFGSLRESYVAMPKPDWQLLGSLGETEWLMLIESWLANVNIAGGSLTLRSGVTLKARTDSKTGAKSIETQSLTVGQKTFSAGVSRVVLRACESRIFEDNSAQGLSDWNNVSVQLEDGIISLVGLVDGNPEIKVQIVKNNWIKSPWVLPHKCPVFEEGSAHANISVAKKLRFAAPSFHSMVDQVMPEGGKREDGEIDELADYNRDITARLCAGCLFPGIADKCFWYYHGLSNSGKSVFVRILHELAGRQFAVATDINTLIGQFGTAGLDTARLISVQEPATDPRKSTEVSNIIKAISGGDPLSINQKYSKAKTAVCNAKLVMASNHLLMFDDEQGAISRRLIAVKLRLAVRAPRESARMEILTREIGGIVAWALFYGLPPIWAAIKQGAPIFKPVITEERVKEVEFSANSGLVEADSRGVSLVGQILGDLYESVPFKSSFDIITFEEIESEVKEELKKRGISELEIDHLANWNSRHPGSLCCAVRRWLEENPASLKARVTRGKNLAIKGIKRRATGKNISI